MLRIAYILTIGIACSCTIQQPVPSSTSIDFEVHHNILIIEGYVNERWAKFVVDTGASTSLLDQNQSKKYRFFEFARVGGYPIIFFMLHIYQAKYGGHFWRGEAIEIPTPYPAQLLQTPKITQNSCFPGAP